jgi:SagB-type dehydrogenase family enzyme
VLHSVFGVQGIRRITEEIAAIRRTSPSAGAMHPVDAFALAINVETLRPGLYHYEADSHCLAMLEAMDRAQARDLARLFVANQEYFASAHVLIIQVARFDRNFWKYPNDKKAYTSVLLDVGHLSQTLYLTATRQALGVFFTSAINDGDIADRLGLDQAREAALGINGLGIPDTDDESLQLKTEAFVVDRSGLSGALRDLPH